MTETMIDLPGAIAKSDDTDFLRELIQDAALAEWRGIMDSITVLAETCSNWSDTTLPRFQSSIV